MPPDSMPILASAAVAYGCHELDENVADLSAAKTPKGGYGTG
jgi:hypothetical protein